MAEDVKQFIVLRLDQELFGIDIKFIENYCNAKYNQSAKVTTLL